jgi:hypothetical protein
LGVTSDGNESGFAETEAAGPTEWVHGGFNMSGLVEPSAGAAIPAFASALEATAQVRGSTGLPTTTLLFSRTEKVGPSELEASRQGWPATRTAVEVPPKSELPTRTPYGELLSRSLTRVASISWTLTQSITVTEGDSTRVVVAWTLAVWSRSYVFLPLGTFPPGPRKVRPEVIIGGSAGAGLLIASIVAVIVYLRRKGEPSVSSEEAVAQEDPVMIVIGVTSSGSISFSGDTADFMSRATEVVANDDAY